MSGVARFGYAVTFFVLKCFERRMVEVGGFEPPTPCMPCKCSPAELNPLKVTALIIRSIKASVNLWRKYRKSLIVNR